MASGAASLFRERDRLRGFASLGEVARSGTGGAEIPAALPPALYPVVAADVGRALTDILALAAPGNYTALTDTVIDLLGLLKETFSERTWRDAVVPAARAHAIAGLMHECPFTRHSFTKPRGYPGDAGLLDFVYRHPSARAAQEGASVAGRTVMALTVDVTACEAVRHRRSILAGKIDDAASRREGPAILAVASGHLREAELSVALKEGRIGRLVAVDQDGDSLKEVDKYRASVSDRIETRQATVRDILAGRISLGRFDLIYAAGLYDYLDAKVAGRLTRKLFGQLNPGGRLLIPNFLLGVREEAYMDAYMDWHLIYRTRQDIELFAQDITKKAIRSTTYMEDALGVIGYLDVEHV